MFVRSRINGLAAARAKILSIGTVMRRPIRSMLDQEARLVAISCAKSTQPFGAGEQARTFGRNRTAADIYKVYTTPGKAYADIASRNENAAKAFWSALNRGDFDKALGILRKDGSLLRNVPIGIFDDGIIHKLNRDPHTGRVKLKTPRLIVRDPRSLEAYIKTRQAHVGVGKSGWADIARKLGSIRGLRTSGDITANWITRNGGQGRIVYSGSDENPIITMTNTVNYSGQILPERDRRIAINIARNRLMKSLLTAARAEMRNARLAA